MDNIDKHIAEATLSKWLCLGYKNYFNLDNYESLKDFCFDIIVHYDAPLTIIPDAFIKDMEFLKELIKKAPNKINDLYDNFYFAYQNFIDYVENPQKLLSRISKYGKLNPIIKGDLQTLICVKETFSC